VAVTAREIFDALGSDDCPWCGGCGAFLGYLSNDTGTYWGESDCEVCDGSGKRPEPVEEEEIMESRG
jgi:hypothetical protein